MSSPLQIALVGYGSAGRIFHAPLITHTPGMVLHSVVSSRRDELRRRFTDVHVRDTLETVLQDPVVDAVVIATPNALHAPMAIAALQAGKHVLVDKPFALDTAEAEQVVAAADAAGRVVSVFQNRRFDADYLTLKALLDAGTLGEIAECHSHFDRFRPVVRDRWREQDAPGSGLWYDLAPHLLDQMLQLFGWPQAITAELDCQRGQGAVDWFHAVLHYPGMRAIIHAGSLVTAASPRFVVHGRSGSWIKPGLDVQEAQLAAGGAPGAPGWGVDPLHGERVWEDSDGGVRRERVDNQIGDYRRVYMQFADAVRGTAAPTVSGAQALRLMRLLDAGQASAREGRRIALV